MEIVHHNQTGIIENSASCVAIEYPFGDKDINATAIELTGRYPDKGRAVNLKCKELCYVINGGGKVEIEGKKFDLQKGDIILVEAGEKYFWEGDMSLLISSVPAWYSEQHKIIE